MHIMFVVVDLVDSKGMKRNSAERKLILYRYRNSSVTHVSTRSLDGMFPPPSVRPSVKSSCRTYFILAQVINREIVSVYPCFHFTILQEYSHVYNIIYWLCFVFLFFMLLQLSRPFPPLYVCCWPAALFV